MINVELKGLTFGGGAERKAVAEFDLKEMGIACTLTITIILSERDSGPYTGAYVQILDDRDAVQFAREELHYFATRLAAETTSWARPGKAQVDSASADQGKPESPLA